MQDNFFGLNPYVWSRFYSLDGVFDGLDCVSRRVEANEQRRKLFS